MSLAGARIRLTDRTRWKPIEAAPRDRDILLWVNGPFIGRWQERDGGQWCEKLTGVILDPVRFWADISPPTGLPPSKANDA